MNLTTNVSNLLTEVRQKAPLVHNITNYVTVNDCANVLIAIGASPIMADDIGETADITSISSALVINIGTLNERTIASMIASGKKANALGIPIIFDPVGAGASTLRNETTKLILDQVKLSILRGNVSEISYVAGYNASTKGVDSSAADANKDLVVLSKTVAKQLGCVVAITGPIDAISDGEKAVKISNGNTMLSRVTGTGCMTTALVGAYAGTTSDYFCAAVAGVASMSIAGEIAYDTAGSMGTGSFHIAIIDALSHLDATTIKNRALFELY